MGVGTLNPKGVEGVGTLNSQGVEGVGTLELLNLSLIHMSEPTRIGMQNKPFFWRKNIKGGGAATGPPGEVGGPWTSGGRQAPRIGLRGPCLVWSGSGF